MYTFTDRIIITYENARYNAPKSCCRTAEDGCIRTYCIGDAAQQSTFVYLINTFWFILLRHRVSWHATYIIDVRENKLLNSSESVQSLYRRYSIIIHRCSPFVLNIARASQPWHRYWFSGIMRPCQIIIIIFENVFFFRQRSIRSIFFIFLLLFSCGLAREPPNIFIHLKLLNY